jgi:hypothetical protein
MRKTLLFIPLLFAAHLQAAGPANFAGTWSLDKGQSKDLPPFYENVKTHSLKITQSAKELVVSVDVTSAAHEPDHFDFTYALDGSPTKAEAKIRTPDGPMSVPATLQATVAADGGLAITIVRELPSLDGGEPMKGTTNEKWHLQPDGKTLVIDRVDEMPRGKFASTMVFTRG